jgi:hypothetical protein
MEDGPRSTRGQFRKRKQNHKKRKEQTSYPRKRTHVFRTVIATDGTVFDHKVTAGRAGVPVLVVCPTLALVVHIDASIQYPALVLLPLLLAGLTAVLEHVSRILITFASLCPGWTTLILVVTFVAFVVVVILILLVVVIVVTVAIQGTQQGHVGTNITTLGAIAVHPLRIRLTDAVGRVHLTKFDIDISAPRWRRRR